MNNYWELIQHDGTRIEIPPSGVDGIKRAMDSGRPIHTAHSGSIPANQIKTFRPTDRPFTSQPLLEDVARAFNEPILNDDGSVQAKWVKKMVTQRKWDTYYSAQHAYKNIGSQDGMVVMAFVVATHDIDVTKTSHLTDEELQKLNKG